MTSRRKAALLLAMAVVTAAAIAWPYVITVAAIADLAGATSVRRWLPVSASRVVAADFQAPTRYGSIPVRIYTPDRSAPTVIVFPGVHAGGIDAPRIARFGERLARTGVRVVTAPLPDLRQFRLTSRATDMIEDVATWTAQSEAVARGERIGLVGVSFAGGLALVAAGRPALAGRLSAVVSVGGHSSLARTLEYLATGQREDGTTVPPHAYGAAVAALAAARHQLTPPDRDTFVEAVEAYLAASMDDESTPAHTEAAIQSAQARALALPDALRSLVVPLFAFDPSAIGAWFRPAIPTLAADPALSPESSSIPDAPVYLLHGRHDILVPATEATRAAAFLTARGARHVRVLVTPLVSHAEFGQTVTWTGLAPFVRFWHDVRQVIDAR